jgi:hypothetical protein
MPALTAGNAKVIQTASVAAKQWGRIDMGNRQNEKDYSPNKAYGDAKPANFLFTRELHRRHHTHGIAAMAFHPGVVATNFANDTTDFMRYVYHTPIIKHLFTISPDKGADQLIWLAGGAPGTTWQPGEYYEKRKAAPSTEQARDPELARQLWDRRGRLHHLRQGQHRCHRRRRACPEQGHRSRRHVLLRSDRGQAVPGRHVAAGRRAGLRRPQPQGGGHGPALRADLRREQA